MHAILCNAVGRCMGARKIIVVGSRCKVAEGEDCLAGEINSKAQAAAICLNEAPG